MTWKKVTVYTGNSLRNTHPLSVPQNYTVDEKCHCCGSDMVPLESFYSFEDTIRSETFPGKVYQGVIFHRATCLPCLNEHPPCFKEHFENPIETTVFDEDAKSWIYFDRWMQRQEWKSLVENL